MQLDKDSLLWKKEIQSLDDKDTQKLISKVEEDLSALTLEGAKCGQWNVETY